MNAGFFVRNPGAFYFGIAENNYDWTSPQNDALWRDGIKTLFDPCPAGWRVPRGGESDSSVWLFFCVEKAAAGTPNAITDTFTKGAQAGFHFYCDVATSVTAWYAATGSRYGLSCEIVHSGEYGHCRSATMAPTGTGHFLTLVPTMVFPFDNATGTASNASALPVRCVRE